MEILLWVTMFATPSLPLSQASLLTESQMISNALIWLLMKLVNFVAAGDEMSESISPLERGVRQRQLLNSVSAIDST